MHKFFSSLAVAIILLITCQSFSAQAELIVCTKAIPNWEPIMGGRLGSSGTGPALIVNLDLARVTWMGIGGYIRLTGEQLPEGVKITQIDGRPSQEKILSSKQTGRVIDVELEDNTGGTGLLRIKMNAPDAFGISTGKAVWQHATDTMETELDFCTNHVLE